MTLKIKIVNDINIQIDTIDNRKLVKYKYNISDINKTLEIWMNIDEDEFNVFCESISKYYHIDTFDVYYKRHRWEYRNGNILRRKDLVINNVT